MTHFGKALLVLLFVLFLTACGGGGSTTDGSAQNHVDDDESNVGTTQSTKEAAPTLTSAAINGTYVILNWTHDSTTPDGGYDVFIDGVDTNNEYRTTDLTATINGLDLSESHCFMVESRYVSSKNFLSSNQVCSQALTAGNHAPSLTGTPETSVAAGTDYSFIPTVNDPDNDSLSFDVSNLPSWASFDGQIGAITGQPQESDIGTYTDIIVSVSDGDVTVSTSPFDIEVTNAQVETGSLGLRWTAPATREDGTVLEVSEIDGYNIYLGETTQTMQVEVDLNDGQADSVTVENIPLGTYFVALTVYDSEGNESDLSNVLEVTVSGGSN
jgi:hypothetical protein